MDWWKSKKLRPAFWTLGVLLLLALAKDVLTNDKPLYCQIQHETFFPGLRNIWADPTLPYQHPVLDSIQQHFLWRRFNYDAAIFAPIPFAPGELPTSPDTTVRRARPGSLHPGTSRRFRHWFGTDVHGYDVAAGMVNGARIAVFTGAMAMGIAFALGLILGAIAGFWGDDRFRIRRGQLWMVLVSLPFAWFYANAFEIFFNNQLGWLIWTICFGLFIGLFALFGKWLSRISYFGHRIVLPVDLIIMRFAEVFTSIPALLVIIAFAAMLQDQTQTLWAMIALIGAFSWPGVALFIRSELLRVRELDYITAARGIGLSEWQILTKHALPNALRPAYTIFAFGIASAILLEASLSFLGYGDHSLHGATWGSLLQNARSSPQLWWISLPPGLAICLTILALYKIGEALSERR